MEDTKECPKCKLVLSRSEFHIVKTKTKKGWRYSSDCKSCQVEYAKAWRKNNPDKYKHNTKKTTLKARYGITIDQFNKMITDQNGMCAICNEDISSYPYVDHNHVTGNVRKLLCLKCNTGLGSFKDSPEILQKAIEYLLTNG
jgi:hypothetical protein